MGLSPQSVIIHERLAYWSRQLRPRFEGPGVRWAETRSVDGLVESARRSTCPVVVLDLGDRPARRLEDLDALALAAPTSLTLVLDPGSVEGVASLARELGATLVWSGPVVPPRVVALVRRWLPIARHRALAEGWSPEVAAEPDPEPWDDLSPIGPSHDTQ